DGYAGTSGGLPGRRRCRSPSWHGTADAARGSPGSLSALREVQRLAVDRLDGEQGGAPLPLGQFEGYGRGRPVTVGGRADVPERGGGGHVDPVGAGAPGDGLEADVEVLGGDQTAGPGVGDVD